MNDSDDRPLDAPDPARISDWLRQRIRKKPPGRLARWLGEPAEFSYEVGRPFSVPVKFITRQRLCRIDGETGLLPFPILPHGSWGVFAVDGEEIYLLEPDAHSLCALLSRERRPLDDGDPEDLAQLFCLILLTGDDGTGHDVICSADHLRRYRWGDMDGYRIDETALRAVESKVTPPALKGTATQGWSLEFTTVAGWMHEKNEVGIEKFEISPEFDVSRSARRILHERIFSETPGVVY